MGAADTYVGVAYTHIDEIIAYIKNNNEQVSEDQSIGKV